MEGCVDADVFLEYVEFQIFLSQGRYETRMCYGNKVEAAASGLLEQLVLHSPKIKSLHSKDHTGSGETADVSYSNCVAPAVDADDNPSSLDASKNELLRAMDSRLAALTEELAAVFDQAAGTKFSFEDITNIERFSYYFGAVDLRNCLQKFVALRQENTNGDSLGKELPLSKNNVRNDKAGPAVKYSASPVKASQLERQSSSASEESSSTSEEGQPSVERSRTLVRSASPRRSASPMRRVQIGRSGSRRSTALTIKSLNFFPARERSVSHRDESASDSDVEEREHASKKSETIVQRMSVQDAIHLFENKQRGQIVDFQKTKSLLKVSVANKAVLSRWSSAVCVSANPLNVASGDSVSFAANKLEDQEIESASEMKPESCPTPEIYDAEAADNDCKSNLRLESFGNGHSKEKIC